MGSESRDLREFWINGPNRIPLRLDWGGQTSLENQWRTSNCCGGVGTVVVVGTMGAAAKQTG